MLDEQTKASPPQEKEIRLVMSLLLKFNLLNSRIIESMEAHVLPTFYLVLQGVQMNTTEMKQYKAKLLVQVGNRAADLIFDL